MHVHTPAIMPQPQQCTASRNAKAASSPVDAPLIERVMERKGNGGRGSHPQQRDERQRQKRLDGQPAWAGTPLRSAGSFLAAALAMLSLDSAIGSADAAEP